MVRGQSARLHEVNQPDVHIVHFSLLLSDELCGSPPIEFGLAGARDMHISRLLLVVLRTARLDGDEYIRMA